MKWMRGLAVAAAGAVVLAGGGSARAAGVEPALRNAAVPAAVRSLWGPWARPLLLRRVDVDLDGDGDLIAVLEDRGLVRAAVACRTPERWWATWQACGGFGVAGPPRRPAPGAAGGAEAGAGPLPTLTRFRTGDLDADGRTDMAVEVATGDGVHHLAVGPLLYREPLYPHEAPLLLRARAFLLWDVNLDGRTEVVAGDLQGAGPVPAFVTFVNEGGQWRRGHGAQAPAAAAAPGSVAPAVRVPDVRTEQLGPAAAQLATAGLRPGMVVAVDMGGRRGFRDVTALLPAVGSWAQRGETVHVALGVPVAHGQVTEWGAVERVVITSLARRVELRPGQDGFDEVTAGFRKVLAAADRRVKVGGPSFNPPPGTLAYYAPTRAEFFFKRPLQLTFRPQRTTVTAQRVLIPFTQYEEGLAFLGTPGYQEAVRCTGWVAELAGSMSRFFPVPRE